MSRKVRDDAQEIEFGWDPRRCIHSAECIHSLPEVLDAERRPWVKPLAASPTPGRPTPRDRDGRNHRC